MGFKNFLHEYFTFNRRERNGVFILLAIILILILYLSFADKLYPKEETGLSKFEKEIIAFEAELKRNEDSSLVLGKDLVFSGNTLMDDSVRYSGYRNKRKQYFEKDRSGFKRESIMVELNSADTIELEKIKGIGAVFAKRIIKFREALGGFVRKEQLREVYGIDQEVFDRISPQIILDTLYVRKINVNMASVEDMNVHPYISKKEAIAIFTSRVKRGDFAKIEEIKNIALMNDSAFIKIAPYLTVK